MMPSTEIVEDFGGSQGWNQEFCFTLVKFHLSIRHPNEDVKLTVRYEYVQMR